MLSFKNRSLHQNRLDEQTALHLNALPIVYITNAPPALDIPPAEEVLKQIRKKRKERQKEMEISDADDDSSMDGNISSARVEYSAEINKSAIRSITINK